MRRDDGRTLFGVGRDKNIVTASLKAVTSAANRLTAGVKGFKGKCASFPSPPHWGGEIG